MSAVKGLPVGELISRGSIKDTDVGRLRRALQESGPLDRISADALCDLDGACRVRDPSWAPFFIGAIADYIVTREAPEGYVATANADWLRARFTREGRAVSKTALDLLAQVIEKARWAPESLCLFVIGEVRAAVVSGSGPLRGGRVLVGGCIVPDEVELVRRVLLGFGRDGIAITRGEADALLAIEEALSPDTLNASWTDLFVKAIANGLMAASGHVTPPRAEALKSELWLETTDLAAATALQKLVRASLLGVWASYRAESREERAIALLERRRVEIITSEPIVPIEARWLGERLRLHGAMTANKQALFDVLRSDSPRINPALQSLLGEIGLAA